VSDAATVVDRRFEVDVSDGVAVLRGEVERPAMIDEAMRAIERVPGLKELRSEATFTTLAVDEREMRTVLEQVIRSQYSQGAVRIVDIHDGVVRLEGHVPDSEIRDRLLKAVQAEPGVYQVESAISLQEK
jgi:osmotically-inducible protein OsmY